LGSLQQKLLNQKQFSCLANFISIIAE